MLIGRRPWASSGKIAGGRLPERLARQAGTALLALQVLQEIGIDASAQTSKTLDRFIDERFDYVITVCDAANDACPTFPNAGAREHWSLPDPSKATTSPPASGRHSTSGRPTPSAWR